MESLFDLLQRNSASAPDTPALLAPGRSPLSYQDLYNFVCQTASKLAASGIGAGDRVAVVLPPGPLRATSFLSVSLFAACAPLNPVLRKDEYAFYLSDLRVNALIAESASHPAVMAAAECGIPVLEVRHTNGLPAGVFDLASADASPAGAFVPARPGDIALLLHTSGTTARPKIVPLTHANLLASARNVAHSLNLTSTDRCLNVMPLFHIHGLVASLLASLYAGGSVICAPGFQAPSFFDWVREFAPTWYTAVPTMHQAVLARAERDPEGACAARFRFIRSCSAPLAPQVAARIEEVFRAPLIEAYGMTEAAHQIASNPLPPAVRKPGSVGLPTGTQVAIMDESGRLLPPGRPGEIVIRGAGVTPGYLDNPTANQAAFSDGWFRTGDQGVVDEDGYLRITGRLKEIINRGGEKISPREIDDVLLDHPAVAQAMAFAVPDPRLGEDVAAAVVLKDGSHAAAAELREFLSLRLADFKVPARIVFVREIPKGPTGKPQRIGMAERLGLPSPAAAPQPAAFEAPATVTERLLADIWSEVLKVERIGVHDDFLSLGGDSVLAAQIAARIRDQLQVEFSLPALFDASTVRRQAAVVEQAILAEMNSSGKSDPDRNA